MAKKKEMTLGEACRTILREGRNAIFQLLDFDNFKLTDDECCKGKCKPKRARTNKGRYKGDDLTTKDVNEAWVGGKAPKKKSRRKKNEKK